MQNKSLVTILASLPLLLAEPLAARTIFPPIGILADRGWDDHCPQGKFLVGFQANVNLLIRTFRIVCAPMSATGARGELWYGPARSGSDRPNQELSCPRDSAIMAIAVKTITAKRNRGMPHTIVGQCVSRVNGARTRIVFGYESNPANPKTPDIPFPQRCPTGESGSGMNGHSYEGAVYALGLDCAVRLPS